MLYIQRDPAGVIVALFRESPMPEAERLAADHPEVQQFLSGNGPDAAKPSPHAVLATLDTAMMRVVEDLIDVLIYKHVIMLTDLPEQAQRKMLARKETRNSLFADRRSFSVGEDDIL